MIKQTIWQQRAILLKSNLGQSAPVTLSLMRDINLHYMLYSVTEIKYKMRMRNKINHCHGKHTLNRPDIYRYTHLYIDQMTTDDSKQSAFQQMHPFIRLNTCVSF